MDTTQLLILAVIQGLTEFLPISSSGHLILPSQVLGWSDQGLAFDVAVHVGSLLAVLLYFRQDVIILLRAWSRSLAGTHSIESRQAWFVIWATVPAAAAGLLFHDLIEQHLRSTLVIAITTTVFGLLLGWSDWRGRHLIALEQMTLRHALVVGLCQALALIPGTSRSGITMTAGLAMGLTRQAAARFSFLLSMPLIALSGGYKAVSLIGAGALVWETLLLGVVFSAVSAGLCIHLFLSWIDRVGMWPFVVYRLLLGAVLFALVFAG